MASDHAPQRNVPSAYLFNGLGVRPSDPAAYAALAAHGASTPLGHTFLHAASTALLASLSAVPEPELSSVSLTPADLTPASLLALCGTTPHHAVLANVALLIAQLLVVLSEPLALSQLGRAEMAGFSSGVLAASVLAASTDVPSFLAYAVETVKLAFWLGLRTHLRLPHSSEEPEPWSLVVLGASVDDVEAAVSSFNSSQDDETHHLYLTAITSQNPPCTTVSGAPASLRAFRAAHLPANTTGSTPAPIFALYHAPALAPIKAAVLADVATHRVRLPSHADLARPLVSTLNGFSVRADSGISLAEALLDMILLQPVRFDSVVEGLSARHAEGGARVLNVGPGAGLARGLAQRGAHVYTVPPPPSPTLTPEHEKTEQEWAAMRDEPIAVVGMAANFPGAPDADALWRLLEDGLNTLSPIPESRFAASAYTGPAAAPGRSMKAWQGNFLADPGAFDHAFFRISPREARSMDPQQRLLLHAAVHALESAGYTPGADAGWDPERFGAYVGVATNDYVANLRKDVDVYYSTGTLPAFLAGRLAYVFGWSGPAVVLDTACSSSMVALHQACRALAQRDCDAALAGGVNVITSPDMFLGLDRGHFLSPTSNCKPWDASADGYARAEGCGLFVLKRLSSALAAGDRVLGVIRASALNQSGTAHSITHPHPPTQIALFRTLLQKAGVAAHDVNVVEAHGTGTRAGDPSELAALRAVFRRPPPRSSSPSSNEDTELHVTSIKANIGHAEAASGAAALAKLLLMLRARAVPACVSLKTLNPAIPPLAPDGMRIDTARVPWNPVRAGAPRRALLNNFGAAGSNAALILEEHLEAPREAKETPVIVGVSAESEAALESLREAYVAKIERGEDVLGDLAYTATARRVLRRFRLAGSGTTHAELAASLKAAKAVDVSKTTDATGVVFVFSGQGGQYAGMGREMYKEVEAFRRVVDECDAKLVRWGFPGVKAEFSGEDGGEDDAETKLAKSHLTLFVLEYALAALWVGWGVKPVAVAGHSLGEYAALVFAGVLSLDDGLRLVAGRAKLIANKCAAGETGMLAVRSPAADAAAILADSIKYDKASIACYNCATDCVVAGDRAQLKLLEQDCKEAGIKTIALEVPYAYHTDAMAPILSDLCELGAAVTLSAPTIPILSNVHGVVVHPGDSTRFTPDYFARHCGEPVRFEEGLEALSNTVDLASVAAYIEIGPHATTLPMLRGVRAAFPTSLSLPSLKKNASDRVMLSAALAQMYATAVPVVWRAVFKDLAPGARVVDLPLYPFAKTRFWVNYTEDEPAKALPAAPAVPEKPAPRFTLLGSEVSIPAVGSNEPAVFETTVERLAELIQGHQVAGNGLCPASVYIELVLAAATLVLEAQGAAAAGTTLDLSDVAYPSPLVYVPGVQKRIRVSITFHASPAHFASFSVSPVATGSAKVQPYCTGHLDRKASADHTGKFAQLRPLVERGIQSVLTGAPETLHTRTAYDGLFTRVVAYSAAYRSMQTVALDGTGTAAYARVRVPAAAPTGAYVVHPVFNDTLLHVAGFVINCGAAPADAFICAEVGKVRVLAAAVDTAREYGVYTYVTYPSAGLAVADVYAVEVDGERRIVACMKRLAFRRVALASFKRVLALAGGQAPASVGDAQPSFKHTHHQPAPQAPPKVESRMITPPAPAPAQDATNDIVKIVAETCGVPPSDIALDTQLEHVGVDSLMSLELAARLATLYPSANIDAQDFAHCSTVRDLVKVLGPTASASAFSSSTALPLSIASSSAPALSPTHANFDGDTAATSRQSSFPPTPPDLEAPIASGSTIKEILAGVLDVPQAEIADDADLEHIGLDSLTSIEALHALQERLGATLPEDLFLTCRSVRALERKLAPPTPAPVLLTGKGATILHVQRASGADALAAPPLVLVHDGSGLIGGYASLTNLGRDVFAIQNTALGMGEIDIVSLARQYAQLIREKTNKRPCIVGGWSFGGVVAFEVARQLVYHAGTPVLGLLLIDSPHPQTSNPLPDALIDSILSSAAPRTRTLLAAQMRGATRALVRYEITKSPVAPPRAVLLRAREPVRLPKVGGAEAAEEVAAFLEKRAADKGTVQGWESALGRQVKVLDIPGDHFGVFEHEHISEMSEQIRVALRHLLQQ